MVPQPQNKAPATLEFHEGNHGPFLLASEKNTTQKRVPQSVEDIMCPGAYNEIWDSTDSILSASVSKKTCRARSIAGRTSRLIEFCMPYGTILF